MSIFKTLLLKEDKQPIHDRLLYLYDKYMLQAEKNYQLGRGGQARVFSSSKFPDKVLRISKVNDDYLSRLQEYVGRDDKHLVKVYYFYEGSIYQIVVMEKLEVLDDDENTFLKRLFLLFDDYGIDYNQGLRYLVGFDGKLLDKEEVLEMFEYSDDWDSDEHLVESLNNRWDDIFRHKKMIEDVVYGLDEMIEQHHPDLFEKNIMKDPKTGNYKLIDL